MKTIAFTSILMISATLAVAQTERGRWQIGTQIGDLNYVDNGTGGAKRFSGSLEPSAGYFIAKNLVLGVGVPLSLSTTRDQGAASVYAGSETKSTIFGLGITPFVRYYLGNAKLKPFLGLSYSYVLSNANYQFSTTPYSVSKSTAQGYTNIITPNLGLAYFVTRTVGLNATLGYRAQSQSGSFLVASAGGVDPTPAVTTKSLNFSLGFQLFFGR